MLDKLAELKAGVNEKVWSTKLRWTVPATRHLRKTDGGRGGCLYRRHFRPFNHAENIDEAWRIMAAQILAQKARYSLMQKQHNVVAGVDRGQRISAFVCGQQKVKRYTAKKADRRSHCSRPGVGYRRNDDEQLRRFNARCHGLVMGFPGWSVKINAPLFLRLTCR